MAVWYSKLYIGEKAAPLYEKIYRSIEDEKYLPGVYLITIAGADKDQLDIFDSIRLFMPALRRRLKPVIGIAYGKDEALDLLRTIAENVRRETGSLYLRSYFEEKLKEQEA